MVPARRGSVLFSLLLAVLSVLPAAAQPNAEAHAKVHPWLADVLDHPESGLTPVLRGPAAGRQGRLRLDGQEALDLLVRTTATRQQLEALGVKVRTLHDGRATITARPAQLAALAARSDVTSISLPQTLRPLLNTSVPETGVSYLRSQVGGVFTGNTGAGVVVGVIDSGIDYDHPDFVDAAGTNRLVCLWDQTEAPTAAGGTTPAAYGYGTEWSTAEIASGACIEEDDPDAFGHGTHVTGTAAGNGAAPDASGSAYVLTGMAPNAKICFVKTDFSSAGIIDAMNYIFDKATALGLPAVINLSLGTQVGAHDGTDPMEEEIDTLVNAAAGRAVVVAAGNEGDADIHAEIQTFNMAGVAGPDFEVPAYTPAAGAGNDVILIAGYYPASDDLQVQLWSPGGSSFSKSLSAGAGSGCTAVVASTDGDVQICNNDASNLSQGTTDNEIVILIFDNVATHDPTAGSWHMALTGNHVAGSGWVDFWVSSFLGDGSSAAAFTNHLDDEETLGIPATANDAIAVGAYMTKLCWTDSTGTAQDYGAGYTKGDIAPFSSRGPTRDGRAKPDVTAPGMAIVSSLAQEVSADLTAAGYGFLITDTYHLVLQGTSMSAPHVTGAVALLFEDDPALDVDDVKDILDDNARQDSFTDSYGTGLFGTTNRVFGDGKLNLGSWASSDPFETNDTYTSAHTIVSGDALAGYIGSATDIDTFYMPSLALGDTLAADLTSLPQNYKLSLVRLTTLSATCGTTFAFTAASSDNAGTANESINYTLTLLSQPRYLRVLSSAGAFDAADSYLLTPVITRPETGAAHIATATAQVLPEFEKFKVAGSTGTGTEQDFYKVTASASATITASTGGTRRVRILNSSGTLLNGGLGSATWSPGLFIGTATYYIEVRANGVVGNYTLTITD